MIKAWKTFLQGILAGISIALGGTVFLSVDNRIAGALFFTIGLFVICTFGLNLYTGKVCYLFERDKSFAANLIPIWLGNLVGTWGTAQMLLSTRIAASLQEKAAIICESKLNDSTVSIFLLSIFCNILIYIAVDGFNKNIHEIGKYLSLFFGVTVFILCGFEHCVANMYYFSIANVWKLKTLCYVLIMTAGNGLGGVFFPAVIKLCKNND